MVELFCSNFVAYGSAMQIILLQKFITVGDILQQNSHDFPFHDSQPLEIFPLNLLISLNRHLELRPQM